MTDLSCLYQLLCSPCEGHLNAFYNIYSYLQKNLSTNSGRIAFDPDFVRTYEKLFQLITIDLDYWEEFYPDSVEYHPRNKLEPLG